jgi:hypothetical protein
MEDVAAVRRAAQRAIEDVTPDRLRERIEDRLAEARMAPGVLTVASARALDGQHPEETFEAVAERAAGVQLIYEGLRLTRTLAREEPWEDAREESNGDILLADILVARGFYLLARTEAAAAAVGVVRTFGRDQTLRRTEADPAYDHALEADVLELAVVAGTTAAGGRAPDRLREYATELGGDELPAPDRLATEDVADALSALAGEGDVQSVDL